jgi:outer membrane lipoprotein-sorting protein
MSTRSRSNALLALLVTVSILSTGIAGAALADSPSMTDAQPTDSSETTTDGEAVVENFTQRIETLETVEFTRTMESEFDDETMSNTVRVVADLESERKRTETIASSHGSNTTTVINATHMTTYNADENTVNTFEYGSNSRGYSMLPQLTQLANESAVEYEFLGTGTLNGEEVYRLNATPTQTPDETDVSLTVAVDTETYFPKQVTTEFSGEQYSVNSTRTYSNVSINGDVPGSTFELDVPADATKPSFSGPDIKSYDDYASLQSDAELSLPAAELPAEYEFEDARIIDGDNYYSVSLTYTNGNKGVHVGVQENSSFDWSERDGVDEVSLDDETGYYDDDGDYAFLHADTGEQAYYLYGQLDEDQLIDIGTAVVGE